MTHRASFGAKRSSEAFDVKKLSRETDRLRERQTERQAESQTGSVPVCFVSDDDVIHDDKHNRWLEEILK